MSFMIQSNYDAVSLLCETGRSEIRTLKTQPTNLYMHTNNAVSHVSYLHLSSSPTSLIPSHPSMHRLDLVIATIS